MFGSLVSFVPLAGVAAMIATCHVFGHGKRAPKVVTVDFYGELS